MRGVLAVVMMISLMARAESARASAVAPVPDDCEISLIKKLKPYFQRVLQTGVDAAYAVWPQPRPDIQFLKGCKIVAHRGAHHLATENTLAAFEYCRTENVWGIEFDVRWTLDNEPVILHDPDAGRTFGRPDVVPARMTLREVQAAVPDLPSLQDLVATFGPRFHLMIELKEPLSAARRLRLGQVLRGLEPVENYHFLSLRPELFDDLASVPSAALLLVSEMNTQALAREVFARQLGGLTGHYLLITRDLQRRLQDNGRRVGTGFIESRYSLYREIHRGVEWVFTNNAVEMARALDAP